MGKPSDTNRIVNRPPWFLLVLMVAVSPVALAVGIFIFGLAPYWAYMPGLLIVVIVIVLPLARAFVFRVDIGQESIVFVKVYGRVTIEKPNIRSFSAFHPLDPVELAKPWYVARVRRLTFVLQAGEKIIFNTIEAHLASKIQEDLVGYGIHPSDESELLSGD